MKSLNLCGWIFYGTGVALISAAVFFSVIGLLGLFMIWGLISAGILSAICVFLHLRFAGKLAGQMGRDNIYSNYGNGVATIIQLVLVVLAVVFFTSFSLVYITSSMGINMAGDQWTNALSREEADFMNQRFASTVLSIPSIAVLLRLAQVKHRKHSFTHFDEEGVHCKYFTRRDIHIPWDECAEIGLASYIQLGFEFSCIYFSKKPLPEKHIKDISRVKISEDCVWVRSGKNVRWDVLQYIDEDMIKHLVDITKKDSLAW